MSKSSKKIETILIRLALFCMISMGCAGGCAIQTMKWIWNAGTPLPLPCDSQNIHGQRGNCD